MNIKKIIKEALDDLQWVRDTEPFTISDKNWIIRNDVDLSIHEDRKIQEWIYSQGYEWADGFTIDEMVTYETTEYFFNNKNDYTFDAHTLWNDFLSDMVYSDGYELFNWSDIKEQLNLNEAEDNDFKWIMDVEPLDLNNTLWIIHHDEPYTEYESEKIQKFLHKNGFNWSNNTPIEKMLKYRSIYYFNVDDHIFDGYDKWVGTLDRAMESGKRQLFKWSDIKEQLNLNESEDNDLKWIMDISSSPEDLVLDKAFEFSPVAETYDKDYEKLNDYLIQLGFEPVYGTPSSVNMGEKVSGLYAYRNGENKLKFVYSPDLGDENYKEHIIDFAEDHAIGGGSNLSVVDARQFINSI